MELQVADNRPPFAVAFAALPRDGEVSRKIQDDLAALVTELARKYFGISSEVMVEGALRGALALVNEGILLTTGPADSAEAWTGGLREKDVLGLCSATTGVIKKIAQAEAGEFETKAAVSRRLLWEFFRQSEMGGWRAAHGFLQAGESAAKRELLTRELAAWLEKHTTVGRVLKLKRQKDPYDATLPDEVINYVVPRCCGIAAQYLDAFGVAEILTEEEPPADFEAGETILLPAKLRGEAKKKYAEFVSGIPARLQPALSYDGRDWFEGYVGVAPEKKKKVSKRRGEK